MGKITVPEYHKFVMMEELLDVSGETVSYANEDSDVS